MPWTDPLADPDELRRCMRDVVALSTLPKAWRNYDLRRIGDSIAGVQLAITSLKPARRDIAPMEIDRILAGLAGLLLLAAYFTHHPLQLLRRLLHRYKLLRHPG